jgi:hypothetical protein
MLWASLKIEQMGPLGQSVREVFNNEQTGLGFDGVSLEEPLENV